MTDAPAAGPRQVSKRHHYLPEFYLSRWATGPHNKLIRFSKPYGDQVKAKPVSPKETGWVDRLYALEGVPPEQSDLFETAFFSPVDAKAATVLQKMKAGENVFTRAERQAWANFLMSLVLRHPESVQAIREHMMANAEHDRANPDQARWRRGDDDPAMMDEVPRQLSTEQGIGRVALNTLIRSIQSRHITESLMTTQWGTLVAPPFSTPLLTSDRPLIWVKGIAQPDFHLLLPIGPRRLFYAVHADSETKWRLRYMKASLLRDFVNEHVTRRAVKYVYGFGKYALPYVQAHMGVDPRPTLIDVLLDEQRMRDALRRQGPRR